MFSLFAVPSLVFSCCFTYSCLCFAARSSFAPTPAEPTVGSFSRSYTEVKSFTGFVLAYPATHKTWVLYPVGTHQVGNINNLVKWRKTNWLQYTSVKLVGFTWCSLSLRLHIHFNLLLGQLIFVGRHPSFMLMKSLCLSWQLRKISILPNGQIN